MTSEQILKVIHTLEDFFQYEGINESGDGENEIWKIAIDIIAKLS